MNLNQLQYFTELARIGHFGKTAEELCITQPSLSYAIGQLEAELGVTLIERKKRPFSLTEEGREFQNYAEKSLEILNEGVLQMKRMAKGAGSIRLGFLRILGISFIPTLSSNYLSLQENPKDIHFEFHSGFSQALLEDLKQEKLDLAFCTRIDADPSIEYTPVAHQDLVLIVPPDHPLAERTSVTLDETLPYPQIFFSKNSGLRVVIDELFSRIGKEPKIAYEVEEDMVLAGLAAQGFGIAVVPYMDELSQLNLKILEITDPPWERIFYMAQLKGRHQTPLVRQFKDFVIEQTKENPYGDLSGSHPFCSP